MAEEAFVRHACRIRLRNRSQKRIHSQGRCARGRAMAIDESTNTFTILLRLRSRGAHGVQTRIV